MNTQYSVEIGRSKMYPELRALKVKHHREGVEKRKKVAFYALLALAVGYFIIRSVVTFI